MEAGLLHLHNFLRWVVLIAGVIAIVRSFMGMSGGKSYSRAPGVVFMASLHLNVVLGLLIYGVFSGVAATFRADVGGAMKIAMLRFFGMEHLVGMLIAAVVVTIGSARARRAANDDAKNKTAAVFFTVGLLIILAVIPWPFRGKGVGRPLFPGQARPAAVELPTPPPDDVVVPVG